MSDQEEFFKESWSAIWKLIEIFKHASDVLNSALPMKMYFSWHHEENTEELMAWLRCSDPRFELKFFAVPLTAPPTPPEMYPLQCTAVCTVQSSLGRAFEACCANGVWQVHDSDQWVPISDIYLAYLIGNTLELSQKAP
jgi:hypothetical protein